MKILGSKELRRFKSGRQLAVDALDGLGQACRYDLEK
jgi:hypothetical protein